MSLASVLLAPLALLLPAAGAVEPARAEVQTALPITSEAPRLTLPQVAPAVPPAELTFFQLIAQSFRVDDANQVRIEQRTTIRITPRPAPVQPSMLMDLPNRPVAPRLIERGMGRCLPIAGIAGVEVSGANNRLILYMRDQRIVSAALERACRARDFYSGFYLQRQNDGQLCVNRDTLLSRSGANCRLTRLRQLIELGS